MGAWRIMIVAGGLAAVMGTIFHLQGMAVVGPESSFMHSNPDWAAGGIWIAAAGIMVLAAGLVLAARLHWRRQG